MVDLPNFLARNHSNRPDPQPTLVMLEAFVANVIQSCQQKVETALRSRSVCLSRVTRRYSHFGAVCWLKGNSPPIESDPCQGCDDAPGLPSNATTCLEHRRVRDALVIRSSWNPAIASVRHVLQWAKVPSPSQPPQQTAEKCTYNCSQWLS